MAEPKQLMRIWRERKDAEPKSYYLLATGDWVCDQDPVAAKHLTGVFRGYLATLGGPAAGRKYRAATYAMAEELGFKAEVIYQPRTRVMTERVY